MYKLMDSVLTIAAVIPRNIFPKALPKVAPNPETSPALSSPSDMIGEETSAMMEIAHDSQARLPAKIRMLPAMYWYILW